MKNIKFTFIILLIGIFQSCATSYQKKGLSFDKELNGFNYPFPVKNFNFSSQNQKLKMAYMDIGKKNNPVIILLHGKNFSQ